MFPQLMELLDAIHSVDVSDTQAYGVFDDRGRGMADSWHTFLRRIVHEEHEQDYYRKWHHLFDETFLERDIFELLETREEQWQAEVIRGPSLLPISAAARPIRSP